LPITTTIESLFESNDRITIASGFTFAEGPVWTPSGELYFSDIRESKRFRLNLESNNLVLIAENTHGGNGMTIDSNGRLLVCQMGKRRVIAIHGDSESIVSDNYKGSRLNAPNDVVPRSDGSLFFTNPEGRISGDDADIGYSGVYRVTPDGQTTEVCAGMNLPNGLAFSPDESLLYVSNTRPDPKLYVFDMQPDGTAHNKREFAEMPLINDTEKNGVPDGLKVDSAGRIFCTGPGGIWIWEPDGTHLGVLEFPEVTTNLAWGGTDLRTMYVTTHAAVYSLRVTTPGCPIPAFA